MTKYLKTKKSSIEEAISSVVLGEAKYEVQYTVSSRVGDSRSRTKSRLSKIDIDARSKEDAEKKFFKQAEKSPMMKDAMRRDMLDVVYVGLKESLNEQKISKELASKILSMNKTKKFVKVSGDLVPEIYMSSMERDDLKKEFGKLPRGLPSATRGVPVVDMINYALGKDRVIDTEGGETSSPKLISWDRGGKVIGRPKTVGDAAKIAGVRMESVDLGEGYEGEVMKILDDAGIDGYFKMGKLYVSKRDAKDAKKALEDADNITKLPPMVKEEKMTKSLKDTIIGMWQESAKDKDEGNAFGAALQAAKEKGEDTFMVAGKKYDVKTEKLVGGQKKLDKDKDGDIDAKDFAMLRKQKKEEVEFKRYHETKQGSLRDAVLQMWGENVKKESKKDLTKSEKHDTKKMTDTGKDVTPVDMSPKMPKIKNEKNRV